MTSSIILANGGIIMGGINHDNEPRLSFWFFFYCATYKTKTTHPKFVLCYKFWNHGDECHAHCGGYCVACKTRMMNCACHASFFVCCKVWNHDNKSQLLWWIFFNCVAYKTTTMNAPCHFSFFLCCKFWNHDNEHDTRRHGFYLLCNL
jgi:hypothetical protein